MMLNIRYIHAAQSSMELLTASARTAKLCTLRLSACRLALALKAKKCTMCCAHGRAAHIPRPADIPRELQEMLKSPSFCDNIRRYNAATGFVSFGDASSGTTAAEIPGQGPPVYVLHGQVYHRISVLMPSGNKDPPTANCTVTIQKKRQTAARRLILD